MPKKSKVIQEDFNEPSCEDEMDTSMDCETIEEETPEQNQDCQTRRKIEDILLLRQMREEQGLYEDLDFDDFAFDDAI